MIKFFYCPDYTNNPAIELAHRLGLQQINLEELEQLAFDEVVLVCKDSCITLATFKSAKIQSERLIDFTSPELEYKRQFGKLAQSDLARAIKSKHAAVTTVLDGTAGFAKDSFLLATLGYSVILCERHPIIFQLILDGLRRANINSETQNIVSRMLLLESDFLQLATNTLLQKYESLPDVVYLDPMFPERTKSALVKQELRWLKAVVGDDQDSDLLLAKAYELAAVKVVVKRPVKAPPLNGKTPSYSIMGKTVRYDVYYNN